MFIWPLLVVSVLSQTPTALERRLSAAYCSEDEWGNCQLRWPEEPPPRVAAFDCVWDATVKCTQTLAASPPLVGLARDELIKAGLPVGEPRVFVEALRVRADWTVVHAYYHRVSGERMSIASVVLVLRDDGARVVLRMQRFTHTALDGPSAVRLHFVMDVRDVDGDGEAELVLNGEGYEAHWLEVFTLRGEKWRLLFSGLGYSL